MVVSTKRALLVISLLLCCCAVSAGAGTIDTDFLQRPWPKQWTHDLEVGRDLVHWRQRASRRDGIFAGLRFSAPLEQQRVWDLANDYSDIGTMPPGVESVQFLERTPTREVIQVDVRVLWKTLRLMFEVEQEPPNAIRFRLANQAIGEYRGLCLFSPVTATSSGGSSSTTVELSTWLKPARPVPMGLVLLVERMTLLQGAKSFLKSCEGPRRVSPHAL